MQKLLTYLSAFCLSFLPPRFRRRAELEDTAELRSATICSGLAQAAFCALLYFALFYAQVPRVMGEAGSALLETEATEDLLTLKLGMGVLGLGVFALQPLNIFVGYLFFEGLVRALAAFSVSENLGTLPLYVVAWFRGGIDEAQYRKAIGPAITDRIHPATDASYDLRVLSSRPKPEWNPYITVRFRGEFYVLTGEEAGEKPWPFVYRLRKNPVGRLVVVIREYHVDDPIRKAPYRGL
jgi:hypothetical protein